MLTAVELIELLRQLPEDTLIAIGSEASADARLVTDFDEAPGGSRRFSRS